jgi:hypothetical protein
MVGTMGGATSSLVMKSLFFVPFLVVLGGCAVSETPDASSASEIVAAPRPDSQHFDNRSQAEKDATIASFAAKNADFAIERESAQVDDLTGGISHLRNTTPLGPRVTLTAPEVVTKATAFVTKNAKELGLTASDITTADVDAKPYPFESGTYPWTVTFHRVTTTPGYEGFETVDRYVAVSVDFSKDGTVGNVYSSTSYFPGLRVSTTPALGADDPGVVKNIVGTELVWHDPSFVPGPDENVGRVVAGDISDKHPVLHLAYDATGFTLTLAYQLEVTRGGHSWTFFVHNRTGAVIESEQTGF